MEPGPGAGGIEQIGDAKGRPLGGEGGDDAAQGVAHAARCHAGVAGPDQPWGPLIACDQSAPALEQGRAAAEAGEGADGAEAVGFDLVALGVEQTRRFARMGGEDKILRQLWRRILAYFRHEIEGIGIDDCSCARAEDGGQHAPRPGVEAEARAQGDGVAISEEQRQGGGAGDAVHHELGRSRRQIRLRVDGDGHQTGAAGQGRLAGEHGGAAERAVAADHEDMAEIVLAPTGLAPAEGKAVLVDGDCVWIHLFEHGIGHIQGGEVDVPPRPLAGPEALFVTDEAQGAIGLNGGAAEGGAAVSAEAGGDVEGQDRLVAAVHAFDYAEGYAGRRFFEAGSENGIDHKVAVFGVEFAQILDDSAAGGEGLGSGRGHFARRARRQRGGKKQRHLKPRPSQQAAEDKAVAAVVAWAAKDLNVLGSGPAQAEKLKGRGSGFLQQLIGAEIQAFAGQGIDAIGRRRAVEAVGPLERQAGRAWLHGHVRLVLGGAVLERQVGRDRFQKGWGKVMPGPWLKCLWRLRKRERGRRFPPANGRRGGWRGRSRSSGSSGRTGLLDCRGGSFRP